MICIPTRGLGISGPLAFQFSKPTKLHPFRFILAYRCLGALLKGHFRQVLSVAGYMYLSGILNPRHIHGTVGTYRRSNPGTYASLCTRYPGPKGAGHTNDLCIRMEFTARVSECLSIRTSTSVCFVSSTPLTVYPIFLKKNAYVSCVS